MSVRMVRRRLATVLTMACAWSIAAPGGGETPMVDGEARFNVALTHLKEGRLDYAIQEFKAAVASDEKNPFFRKGLGQAYTQKGMYKEALEQLRKALALNPHFVDVRNDIAAALLLSGQRVEGKKELVALYAEPTNPRAEMTAWNLGQAYLEEGNYTDAAAWFQTAIGRNKDYAEAYVGLARVLVLQGRSADAITQLEIGSRNCPGNVELMLAHGQALYRVGRFSDARIWLESAKRSDPTGAAGQTAAALLDKFPK